MTRRPLRSVLLCLFLGSTAWGQDSESSKYAVTFDTDPSLYHILYRGTSLDDISRPVRMTLGTDDPVGMMRDTVPMKEAAYYRAETLSQNQSRDTDDDGLTDVEELRDPATHHPLNAVTVAARFGTTVLTSREQFESLARRDNVPGADGIRELKFIFVDIDTATPELYLINTQEYIYHYAFYTFALNRPLIGGDEFNLRTYFPNTRRRNLAGSLLAHDNYVAPDGQRGLYTMKFWPTDPVAFRFVNTAYEMLSASLPFIDGNLAYHPAGETQRTVLAEEKALFDKSLVRSINTEELFGSVTYTAMHLGESYGRLVLAEGVGGSLTARDIVIFRNLPNDLTHVAGILTEAPQTPLSHVNLKARQNNTPNAYLKNASTDERIQALLGKNVRYEVTSDGFLLEEATDAEIATFLESLRPLEPQVPVRNLAEKRIRPFQSIPFSHSDRFGAKAANLSELHRLLPTGMTPSGHAIPFSFYDRFMEANGLYEVFERLLTIRGFDSDSALRESELTKFRKRLREAPVPESLVADIEALQTSFPLGTSIRCRSSTNNEDLPGFNGAGLYDSYTHFPDEGSLAKTIKQVWASLWNYRAFEERSFYRISHREAAMGVIAHPSYQDEYANGVAVSKNLIDPNWIGYYVNMQVGEDLVTNPTADAIPEELLVSLLAADPFINNLEYEVQYVRQSNRRTNGEPILTQTQILNLADQLEAIQSHFQDLYQGDSDFAMEIEFKIEQDSQLVIKQARPWID